MIFVRIVSQCSFIFYWLSPPERRFRASQIIIITNFVVVLNICIQRVNRILKWRFPFYFTMHQIFVIRVPTGPGQREFGGSWVLWFYLQRVTTVLGCARLLVFSKNMTVVLFNPPARNVETPVHQRLLYTSFHLWLYFLCAHKSVQRISIDFCFFYVLALQFRGFTLLFEFGILLGT